MASDRRDSRPDPQSAGRGGESEPTEIDGGSADSAAAPSGRAAAPRPPLPVDPNAPTVMQGATEIQAEAHPAEPQAEAPPPPAPAEETGPTLARGTVLFGEYEIEGLLGAGGMGAVYRARHRRLGESRAIKVLQPSFGTNQETASRLFDREAKALLKLRDPAVVRCHDLLSDDEGRVYLVMELVEGVPLIDLVQQGPLPRGQVIELGKRLAAGLSAAHRQGIVHRDLAPDNVVLPDGRPESAKLIDFGIAKEFESSHTTVLEGFKGKLRYASPEQMGFFDGKIDGRSDYYSLGLTLYTAATGRPLDMGRTFAQAVDARRSFHGLPKGLPSSLRELIEPLLAFDPNDRPSNLEEHFGVTPGQPTRPLEKPAASRTGVWIGGGLVGAAALGAAAWLLIAGGLVDRSGAPGETAAAAAGAALEPVIEETPAEAEATPPSSPETVVARTEPKPAPRQPTALERAALIKRQLQIDSLLRSGDAAVRENRLTRPLGESALDKYRRVLELDPDNQAAQEGLATVSGRLLEMSSRALERGDVERARELFEKAEATTPDHPGLAALRPRFGG
ncbi:MAG: protein kinase domain-containing protein [Myxococcota bacterium]